MPFYNAFCVDMFLRCCDYAQLLYRRFCSFSKCTGKQATCGFMLSM